MIDWVLPILAGLAIVIGGTLLLTGLSARLLYGEGASARAATTGWLALNLGYSAVLAVIGGFVTGKYGGFGPAAALAGILVIIGIATAVGGSLSGRANEDTGDLVGPVGPRQPSWYPIAITAVGAVGVLVGGYLATRI
jgi:hypothetical protein